MPRSGRRAFADQLALACHASSDGRTSTPPGAARRRVRHLTGQDYRRCPPRVPEFGLIEIKRGSAVLRRLSEFDLMAQLAGFVLEARHADWAEIEFTADTQSHVSIYRIPAP